MPEESKLSDHCLIDHFEKVDEGPDAPSPKFMASLIPS